MTIDICISGQAERLERHARSGAGKSPPVEGWGSETLDDAPQSCGDGVISWLFVQVDQHEWPSKLEACASSKLEVFKPLLWGTDMLRIL